MISSQSSFSLNVSWEEKVNSTLGFRRNENQTKSKGHSGDFMRDFWVCGMPMKAIGIWPASPSVTSSEQKDTVIIKKYWQLFLSNELKVCRTQQGAWHNGTAFLEKRGYYRSIKLFFNQIFHTLKHIKQLEKKTQIQILYFNPSDKWLPSGSRKQINLKAGFHVALISAILSSRAQECHIADKIWFPREGWMTLGIEDGT